jgi:hypothetical protein
MGIQHEEVIPESFGGATADNYLGSPAVSARLIGQFCAEVEADITSLCGGLVSSSAFSDGLVTKVRRFADIFSGRDPEYQTIKGYHEHTLRFRLMADLGEYWQSHRAKWNDDPVCVMFEWLAVTLAEKVKLSDGDDMLLGVMMGPTVEYCTKVVLGTERRAA